MQDQNTIDLARYEKAQQDQDIALESQRTKWLPIITEIEVLYQQMLDMAETEEYDFTEEAIEDLTNTLEGL